MSQVTIQELEKRHDFLATEVAAVTKYNQGRRFEVAISQRGRSTALIFVVVAALFAGFAIAATYFPKTRYFTIDCP